MASFPTFWLTDSWPARALGPLAMMFRLAAAGRRRYLGGRATRAPAPVIVVGSIFVGGTGKTPVVSWLVQEARRRGWRPGVVLRGYGGGARQWPLDVTLESPSELVGDEAVLLARRTGGVVVADPDRTAAARRLVEVHGCNLVIADDGLQHYRLARDAEVVVLDGQRMLGNGRCLPAGPLREPPERLASADLVIGNGAPPRPYGDAWFRLVAGEPLPVNPAVVRLARPVPGESVEAVAGIGHPGRFFQSLEEMGYRVTPHAFNDHHRFHAADFDLPGDAAVLMTEKDAVKSRAFDKGRLWYLPVSVAPEDGFIAGIAAIFDALSLHSPDGRDTP